MCAAQGLKAHYHEGLASGTSMCRSMTSKGFRTNCKGRYLCVKNLLYHYTSLNNDILHIPNYGRVDP